MKIRTSFVSNSSSSSFCVVGGIFHEDALEEMFKKYHIQNKHFWDNVRQLNKVLREYDLSVYEGDEDAYIGLSIDKMEDNETKAEFIERANTLIQNAGIDRKYDRFVYGEISCN